MRFLRWSLPDSFSSEKYKNNCVLSTTIGHCTLESCMKVRKYNFSEDRQ